MWVESSEMASNFYHNLFFRRKFRTNHEPAQRRWALLSSIPNESHRFLKLQSELEGQGVITPKPKFGMVKILKSAIAKCLFVGSVIISQYESACVGRAVLRAHGVLTRG